MQGVVADLKCQVVEDTFIYIKSVFTLVFIVILLLVKSSDTVMAATWEEVIAKVERRANEYHEKATALGWPVHAGTIYNELDIQAHTCAILGRMLGKESLIRHLERDYPNSSTTGSEFRLAAISLGNWAYTAKRLLQLDGPRRIKSWNLDCVGHHDIPKAAHIEQANSSAFFDVDDQILRVLGDVTDGFAARLAIAIRSNPAVKYVALGSGGGSVGEALRAGRLIRAHRLETTLWNNCYSACSLVFLGGSRRTIWSPYPKLGFHMMSKDGAIVPSNDPAYLELAKYAREMGVEWKVVIGAMLSAPPNGMHYLTHDQMCDSRVASWIQRICGF